MAGRKADFEIWELLWERVGVFATGLSRNQAQHVNSANLRQQAREIVQEYFREVKPALQRLGVTASTLTELDSDMQTLIGLAAGRNAKSSYQKLVRTIRARRKEVEMGLEFLIGAEVPVARTQIGRVEEAILTTLSTMLPAAAASYRQVLVDVQDGARLSYRGTAAELREVVREVLDHLAPDDAVTAAPGFKLEEGLKGPSMKQKVRFIMKARKVPDAGMKPAEDSVKHLNDNIPALSRSGYNRGSMDVHTARSREEVLNLKLYADAVLGELLEIHKSVSQVVPAK